MTADMTALVTKQDLTDSLEQMKREILDGVRIQNVQFKQEILDGVHAQNAVSKTEILDGVRFLNETLFHDFQGAYNDKTALLHDKVYTHDREIASIKHLLRLR